MNFLLFCKDFIIFKNKIYQIESCNLGMLFSLGREEIKMVCAGTSVIFLVNLHHICCLYCQIPALEGVGKEGDRPRCASFLNIHALGTSYSSYQRKRERKRVETGVALRQCHVKGNSVL